MVNLSHFQNKSWWIVSTQLAEVVMVDGMMKVTNTPKLTQLHLSLTIFTVASLDIHASQASTLHLTS